ncbi:hypothetical protein U1Q18_015127, partial [Sarracenia purpurea var. burkii]
SGSRPRSSASDDLAPPPLRLLHPPPLRSKLWIFGSTIVVLQFLAQIRIFGFRRRRGGSPPSLPTLPLPLRRSAQSLPPPASLSLSLSVDLVLFLLFLILPDLVLFLLPHDFLFVRFSFF